MATTATPDQGKGPSPGSNIPVLFMPPLQNAAGWDDVASLGRGARGITTFVALAATRFTCPWPSQVVVGGGAIGGLQSEEEIGIHHITSVEIAAVDHMLSL